MCFRFFVNMKIAVLFEKDKLSNFGSENSKILIFEIENNFVVGAETIDPGKELNADRLFILKKKQVDEIYLSAINDELKEKISLLRMRVKTSDMLVNDKLFNSLYISGYML